MRLFHSLRLILSFPVVTLCVSAQPTVRLDSATVMGLNNGNNTQFLGIPFAQPPVGSLRLQLPRPLPSYTGTINATTPGNQCIQKHAPLVALPSNVTPNVTTFLQQISALGAVPQSEDCLNINVIVPTGAKPGDKFPVAAWIYGGGNEFGSNTVVPGGVIVNRSVALGQPVIFVSMNYRLNAFGFLGGREILREGVGNLGLHDQREGLRWIQKYIFAFGGDPTKVTIFGESAGGESVALQMVANGGNPEGLFRAAWMDSGSLPPSENSSALQPTFDSFAADVGCASAKNVLACLRDAPLEAFIGAMNKTESFLSFKSLGSPWALPRPDGVFLTGNPQKLAIEGRIADVPIVLGATEDEGTLFSLSTLNITNDAELTEYLSSNYFPPAPKKTIARILQEYPENPAVGSPFGTGDDFAFTPEYKRISAFNGDLLVQAPRRLMLSLFAERKQKTFSFISQRAKIPGLGAAHTTELRSLFGSTDLTDFLIRFVNTLDPNDPSDENVLLWPEYSANKEPQILALLDGNISFKIISDTFRMGPINFVRKLSLVEGL